VSRPSFESIFLRHAFALAERSTCARLSVGCVITTVDFTRTLAIGYNGNARGFTNGCDTTEPGACGCIHAEANAVIKCAAPHDEKVVFVTDSPCPACAKFIVQLGGVKRVVFVREYRKPEGLLILGRAGIDVERVDDLVVP
jgi:deoxycytidylate deaminase